MQVHGRLSVGVLNEIWGTRTWRMFNQEACFYISVSSSPSSLWVSLPVRLLAKSAVGFFFWRCAFSRWQPRAVVAWLTSRWGRKCGRSGGSRCCSARWSGPSRSSVYAAFQLEGSALREVCSVPTGSPACCRGSLVPRPAEGWTLGCSPYTHHILLTVHLVCGFKNDHSHRMHGSGTKAQIAVNSYFLGFISVTLDALSPSVLYVVFISSSAEISKKTFHFLNASHLVPSISILSVKWKISGSVIISLVVLPSVCKVCSVL